MSASIASSRALVSVYHPVATHDPLDGQETDPRYAPGSAAAFAGADATVACAKVPADRFATSA
jgi:hypothetical protein